MTLLKSYPAALVTDVQVTSVQPDMVYSPQFEVHAATVTVPAYPLAQRMPLTSKEPPSKLTSFTKSQSYPGAHLAGLQVFSVQVASPSLTSAPVNPSAHEHVYEPSVPVQPALAPHHPSW